MVTGVLSDNSLRDPRFSLLAPVASLNNQSMLTLFEMCTTEGWTAVMYQVSHRGLSNIAAHLVQRGPLKGSRTVALRS